MAPSENNLSTSLLELCNVDKVKEKPLCVVRLRTSMWQDSRGLHTKKSLLFLRKQSQGFNLLEEDSSQIGADAVLPRIINLHECDDGVYKAVVCNESRDWESGYVDDYDYRLIPVNPDTSHLDKEQQ